MRHPFESIPPGKLRLGFLPALILYALLQLVFAWLDGPLRTPAAPAGIVSFELAGSVEAAQGIVGSWNHFAQLDASFGLGLDFLFMAAYSSVIGLAAVWAGRALAARGWPLAGLSGLVAWGLWLAVLSDSVENVMLLSVLFFGPVAPRPELAAVCAAVKFALIALGLVYVGYGTLGRLIMRPAAARSAG